MQFVDAQYSSHKNFPYDAKFANEPYSEYRIKPRYLSRFIENGLLERQRKNILKSSENSGLFLQLTFEHICSNLPINKDKKPHEKVFPFTADRLCQQLAADGQISMETVLDYLYATFSNIPDHIIASLGYIPKLSDLANFHHHEIDKSDPIYFRYYLYNFILWCCRPSANKKVMGFSIEKEPSYISGAIELPSPTIWFEDGSYITLEEWLNYETGGFEDMCARMDGVTQPRAFRLPDGSVVYRELECVEAEPELREGPDNIA